MLSSQLLSIWKLHPHDHIIKWVLKLDGEEEWRVRRRRAVGEAYQSMEKPIGEVLDCICMLDAAVPTDITNGGEVYIEGLGRVSVYNNNRTYQQMRYYYIDKELD